MTDELLAGRAQEGNSIALAQLFQRYQDRIFSYHLRLLQNRQLAEEASQETFIKGIRGLGRYRERGLFKSWIFKIAYHEGLRILKKEKSGPEYRGRATDDDNSTSSEPMDPSPSPGEYLIQNEQRRLLEYAIQKLPDQEKQVVLLRIKEELPFKDIASIMNCSINTTLGRMHNAVKRLSKILDEISSEKGTPNKGLGDAMQQK